MSKVYLMLFVLLQVLIPFSGLAQDVTVKIGEKDALYSKILNENRNLVISLPADYATSTKKYPTLYLLDGTENNLIDARLVTYNLKMEMIIVAIANTDRDRDMMPLSKPSYVVENPEAENFLLFLEKELIPHIQKKYRTTEERTIRGRSLSGLFVMYAFLAKPALFNNYIGNCAGWFTDMDDFFTAFSEVAFQRKSAFHDTTLFVANSLADPLDPEGQIHQSILRFSQKLEAALGDQVRFHYKTYEDAGHVPYSAFYDGMKFINKNN